MGPFSLGVASRIERTTQGDQGNGGGGRKPYCQRPAKDTSPFGYLVKPFEAKELRSVIEIALHKNRMQRELKESDLWDPAKNILAGTRLLAVLLRYYRQT
jgi:hypothetical protein